MAQCWAPYCLTFVTKIIHFKNLPIEIRSYTPSDRDSVLKLIEESISTNRTPETWEENKMTAALAFDNKVLIGALPLERRHLEIGGEKSSEVLWISAAHVDKEHRSRGVGTKLDRFIRNQYQNEVDALCVYRGEESSRAYKWYKKMDYHPLLTILAYKKEVSDIKEARETIKIESADKALRYGSDILKCFRNNNDSLGGFPKRNLNYWQRIFSAHYYGADYKFIILALPGENEINITAYALLGITDMRDRINRSEILEFCALDLESQESLHKSIEQYANSMGLKELRIQVSDQEALRHWLEEKGFISRNHSTKILASVLNPSIFFAKLMNKSSLLNLTVETPVRGIFSVAVGNGMTRNNLSLFMNDDTLHKLLFRRLNLADAISDGQLIIRDGTKETVDSFCSLVSQSKWRYFQTDYI
jgi:predicted acetyltransferase